MLQVGNGSQSQNFIGRGLEHPRRYQRQYLKLERLPISPFVHGVRRGGRLFSNADVNTKAGDAHHDAIDPIGPARVQSVQLGQRSAADTRRLKITRANQSINHGAPYA